MFETGAFPFCALQLLIKQVSSNTLRILFTNCKYGKKGEILKSKNWSFPFKLAFDRYFIQTKVSLQILLQETFVVLTKSLINQLMNKLINFFLYFSINIDQNDEDLLGADCYY